MSRSRLLPLLIVAFLGIAALVALQSQQFAQMTRLPTPTAIPPTLPGTLLRVFDDLAVLDIQAIRLENVADGGQLTLSRDRQGNWTAPDLEGEIDATAASSIARTLVLLPYARSINILPDTEFADFGFESGPQMLISIVKVDNETHTIAVGDLSQSEPVYYALADERDEIFLLERGPVDFLRNSIVRPPIRLTN